MGRTILVGVAVWVAALIVLAMVLPPLGVRSEVGSVLAFAVAVAVAVGWRRRNVRVDDRGNE